MDQNNKNKKIVLVPQNVKLYLKEDRNLQIEQNRLLYHQNIFTVVLGILQIVVAILLTIRFF